LVRHNRLVLPVVGNGDLVGKGGGRRYLSRDRVRV
jgi:hypothetical protein